MDSTYEAFSEEEKKILEHFVTNTEKNIFGLRNLPEVIKGALFSRYSRSAKGLRSLLLKEFIQNDDTSFSEIVGHQQDHESQLLAIKKAQNFYDRILDGYGDDSIGELGGAHLAIENVSMLAAKAIEDRRIGGSPLEKSTRYICFDKKVNGEFLFYKEPVLMTSAYRDLYLNTCNELFETYSRLIEKLTERFQEKFPKEAYVSSAAYNSALRAKVLDCLRGLLPASALTNLGMFGNGRFYEKLIQTMQTHNLSEMQNLGKEIQTELSKIIPSFVRRAENESKYQKAYAQFFDQMQNELQIITEANAKEIAERESGVYLVDYDADAVTKVAAGLLFEKSFASLESLQEYTKNIPAEEVARILDAASNSRENRRHKSPRALELANYTFEFVADFGIYRDLQRHRILTQERQLLTCNYGYYMPLELMDTDLEQEYVQAMEKAKEAYDIIAKELPEEAQYVVPMAYKMHWYFHINLRSLQWLCELRSSPAGHANYRYIAQEMVRQVLKVHPQFESLFKFVDFEGYDLGRMGQEIRKEEKIGKK